MNRLQLLLSFLLFGGVLFAQPAGKFFTTYADPDDNNRTEFYTVLSEVSEDGICFAVVHETFTLEGELIFTEGGLAECEPKNGKYGVKMNSEKTNLWVSFSEDGSGYLYIELQKADKTTRQYKSTSPESSEEIDPYADIEYNDGEEETHEQEPDLYLSESGAQFYLVSLDGYMAFGLVGATNENCEMNDVNGTLLMDDSGSFYTFSNEDGCDVFRIDLRDGQLILTEGNCTNMHPDGCSTWNGVYYLYVPNDEPEYMDIEGSGEPIYYDDEEVSGNGPDMYTREDGVLFYLFQQDESIEFDIIDINMGSCETESNSVSGMLVPNESGTYYTYTNLEGCEVLRATVSGDQVTIKEGKCKGIHGKGCTSWNGTYQLNIE